MSLANRKQELFEKYEHITTECSKLNNFLTLAHIKSNAVVNSIADINDSDLLKNFTKIYKYLSSLHFELLDINCRLELFFINSEKGEIEQFFTQNTSPSSVEPISTQNSPDINNETINKLELVQNYLDQLKLATETSSQSGSTYSKQATYESKRLEENKQIVNLNEVSDVRNAHTLYDNNIDSYNISNTSASDILIDNNSPLTQHFSETETTDIKAQSSKIAMDNAYASTSNENIEVRTKRDNSFKLVNTSDSNSSTYNETPKRNTVTKIKSTDVCGTKFACLDSQTSRSSSEQNNDNNDTFKLLKLCKENSDITSPETNGAQNTYTTNESNVFQIKSTENQDKIPTSKEKSKLVQTDVDTSTAVIPLLNSLDACIPNGVPDSEIIKRCNTIILPVPDPNEGDMCCLGCVESPSHFYIQIACEESAYLDYLSKDIEASIDNLPFFTNKSEAMTIFDTYCVCYCEKNQDWFRAQVIDWLADNEDVVIVKLIDYGYIVEAPLTNLREILPHLCSLPKTALRCHLAFLNPAKGDTWPQEAIDFFKEKVKPHINCLYTLSFVERQENSLAVDLKTDEIPSLIGVMVLSGYGRTDLPEYLGACSTLRIKDHESSETDSELSASTFFNDFMKQQIHKAQNTTESNADQYEVLEEYSDPNLAVSHYNPKDERRVCKFFSSRGGCWKGTQCRFSHEPLNPEGWTTDRELVYYRAFHSLDFPGPGVTAKVKVKCIRDLRTFYVHIKSFPDMNNTVHQPVNSLKALIKMMNHPNEIKNFRILEVIPAPTQIILVQYCEDWQRASVVDVIEQCSEIKLEVLLVDFGYIFIVNMKDAREIKPEYLYLPFQAVRCVLCNTKLKDDLTDEEVQTGLDYLEMCSFEKLLEAKIMYTSLHLGIILYDENGHDIAEQLIQANLVEECSDLNLSNTNMLVD